MIIISIILFLAVVSLGYGCFNLIRQNEQLEDTAVYYQDKFNEIREMALKTEVKSVSDVNPCKTEDESLSLILRSLVKAEDGPETLKMEVSSHDGSIPRRAFLGGGGAAERVSFDR